MMAVFCTYGALVFFLVCGSCSSVREGRAAKRAWTPVTEQKDCTYLALIQCGTDKASATWSSGTIISDSVVLTYSTCTQAEIVVYANFTSFDTSKEVPAGTQVRNVEKVDTNEDLKIFILNESWIFTENMLGAVKLADQKSGRSAQTCTVLGYEKATAITPHNMVQQIGGKELCKADSRDDAKLLYSKGAETTELLKEGDYGGPAVTAEGRLLAINMKGEKIEEAGKTPFSCNTYINVAKYREWIEEQKNAAESGAPGGTGGNSTSPSSGYSIHSYLNKYSNWKVLGFLVPTIVTFLQY